jgi:DNA-binding transcriptional LysR family regulator
MRLTLDALSVLDAIDRRGSFAAAAEELHRVPSAVTYAVQKLEEDLGISLFDRSGHRAQLTEAGRELLREGRHLLNAAAELEARVKRVAKGFEVELRVALDTIVLFDPLYPVIEEFYRQQYGTRLKLSSEVFGGTWDALVSDRADLAIGAVGDGPLGGGYSVRPLGHAHWQFMVASSHALARMPEPLRPEDILPFRSVVAADSSRSLPPRTMGLLDGQEVLVVPDMATKIAAQCAGLGVGYLPLHITRTLGRHGTLVPKRVVEERHAVPLFIAWPTAHRGKALDWFLARLNDADLCARLIGEANRSSTAVA